MELEAVGEVADDGIPSPDDLFSSTSTWNGRDIHYQRLEFKRPRFRRGRITISYETHPFGTHFRQLADIATCHKSWIIPILKNKCTFQLRQSCRDSSIVSWVVLSKYNPTYDRRIAALSRAQMCIYF